jgi:hypothetical protein
MVGKKYLNKALGGIIHSILHPGKKDSMSCEINPDKLMGEISDQKKSMFILLSDILLN